MLYGKIGNYETYLQEVDLRKELSHMTLPNDLSNELLEPLGYFRIEESYTDLKETASKKLSFNIVKKDDKYVREWFLKDLDSKEESERRYFKWKYIREERDRLLNESDKTQTFDYMKQTKEWVKYREILRDIPEIYDDPYLVIFPTKPSSNLDSEIDYITQRFINTKCRELGYDNENAISKYLTEDNPFYIECTNISLWIGKVWEKANSIKNNIKNRTLEPIIANIEDMLPILTKKELDTVFLTPMQIRLYLVQKGMLNTIEALIKSNVEAQIIWNHAKIIKRDNALVNAMAQDLELSEEQLDEMFLEASKIII